MTHVAFVWVFFLTAVVGCGVMGPLKTYTQTHPATEASPPPPPPTPAVPPPAAQKAEPR